MKIIASENFNGYQQGPVRSRQQIDSQSLGESRLNPSPRYRINMPRIIKLAASNGVGAMTVATVLFLNDVISSAQPLPRSQRRTAMADEWVPLTESCTASSQREQNPTRTSRAIRRLPKCNTDTAWRGTTIASMRPPDIRGLL